MSTERHYIISNERKETYRKAAERAEIMLQICKNILNDNMTELQACQKENMPVMSFRNFCKSYRNEEVNYSSRSLKWYSWEEEFLKDLTNEDCAAPDDFSEIFDEVVSMLSERDRDILIRYYKNNEAFRTIAKDYGVSHERIRQILSLTLRKLRVPTTRNLLVHGWDYMKAVKELNTAQKRCDMAYFKRLAKSKENVQLSISELKEAADKCEEAIQNIEKVSDADIRRLLTERMSKMEISDLNLSKHTQLAVKKHIKAVTGKDNATVLDLYRMDITDLRKLRSVGAKSIDQISERLTSMFGVDLEAKWCCAEKKKSGLIA